MFQRLVRLSVILFLSLPVMAQQEIDVIGGKIEPFALAIPDFVALRDETVEGISLSEIGDDIARVINQNLTSTSLFRVLPKTSYIETLGPDNPFPKFSAWKPIGAEGLVTGRLEKLPNGSLRVEFRLWDVSRSQQLVGVVYTTQISSWRRIAHVISDKIYTRITGDAGYFDTRIVYISEEGPITNRVKRLAIMDQDGENQQYLTDGNYLVLTPRFSPNRQEITFLSYFNNKPRVYLLNILNNKFEVLGNFEKNMTFAPRFSPDGNKVIMSLMEGGNSEIYEMDLRTRKSKQLTNNPAIDTAPSYSPDGKKIVFESNRGGTQQLYVMNADGTNVRRISFSKTGSARYATPVWSPRGDLIAFTKIGGRKFRIGVMRPDGSGERLLTNAYQDEGPTWSPNGRVLMFFRTDPAKLNGKGKSTLWSVDLTGYNEKQVKTIEDASDPAWSPPMPLSTK